MKFLARAGVASRRGAADLVVSGRVKVNGALPRGPGDPIAAGDVVTLDGRALFIAEKSWLVLHKPTGYVTSRTAEPRFPSVFDLLPGADNALVAIGRLDVMSEGVLLFTTDGDLAARLMHPRWQVPRRYAVLVSGTVNDAILKMIRQGVAIDDGPPVKPAQLAFKPDKMGGLLELELLEGRNRLVRKVCEVVGLTVRTLTRTAYGPVSLGDLRSGASRPLSKIEVAALYDMVGLQAP